MANDTRSRSERRSHLDDVSTVAVAPDIGANSTRSRQQTITRRTLHKLTWRNFPYVSLLLATVGQNLIWWLYPLIYSQNLEGGHWNHNLVLLAYSILLAAAIFMTLNSGFRGWSNYFILLLPAIFLYFLYQRMSVQQVILLALLPIALVLIHTRWLNLQNILGLILFSGLATLTVPVSVFYQQNTYLTMPFIFSLLPLLLAYLFFMSAIFVPNGRKKRATSLAFGVALLLDVLTLPWNGWTFMAVIIIIFTWMVLINLELKQRYRMTVFTVLETITVLAFFLQQR
jgi:hypothetical protein